MPYRSAIAQKIGTKKLCFDCIGEEYLSSIVEDEGKLSKCSYCNENGETLDLNEIADLVEEAFEAHYVRSPTEPDPYQYHLHADKESDYEWEREGEPVIAAIAFAADISDEVAKDIQALLEDRYSDRHSYEICEETEYSSDSYYQKNSISDDDWQRQWEKFERILKTEARFFSRTGAEFLGKIFNDIDKKLTDSGSPLVITAGENSRIKSLYRARVFQSLGSLEDGLRQPDLHLGPPPSSISKAGRMNAAGISVFYGATNSQIALAEVRPPVGSYVAVAKFELIRPLRLLDLTVIEDILESGSIFDPEYANLLAKAKFLGSLKSHITRPVLPNDESIEYVSTQAVADFLATEVNVPLDGIIFPSVQSDAEGQNVVLFRKASVVEKHRFPKNSKIEITMGYFDGEEWVDEITVRVATSSEPAKREEDEPISFELFLQQANDFIGMPYDLAPATLRIVLESIEIHNIEKIEVKSSKNIVNWYQSSNNHDPL